MILLRYEAYILVVRIDCLGGVQSCAAYLGVTNAT